MMNCKFAIVIAASCVMLTSCGSISANARKDNAFSIANEAGMSAFSVNTKTFRLAGFSRVSKPVTVATIYIEGDGLAWLDRYTVSSNPTPRNPVALKLASLDQDRSVIYLARPCQYVNLNTEKYCDAKYWTSHRFAEVVIESYQQAIETLVQTYAIRGIHLVGFSGGGAIAALVADRRDDIMSLRTVAGNLDHIALSKHHRASVLFGSLNAIDVARSLERIAQTHYSGSRDKTVPAWVTHSFSIAANTRRCSKTKNLKGIGHTSGWEKYWKQLSKDKPKCQLQ